MSNFINLFALSYESLLILTLTAVTCALIGNLLVLRKLSMVSDAISHSVLLGIVLAFFITHDLSSPLLLIGAGLFGLLAVFSIETLSNSGLVRDQSAIGIIYPLFFSIAVILISKFARNVHLDTDIVLMGDVIMSSLNRTTIFGISLPKSVIQMTITLLVNLAFIILFFKEIKISTFDPEYAKLSGFSIGFIFYAIMTLVSFSSVVAFNAVGAILVISFLIAPGASAYLVSKDLKVMIALSCLYAIFNSLIGFTLALFFNLSISGMTATIAGLSFLLTVLFNKDGLITQTIKKRKDKKEIKEVSMILHVGNHMTDADEKVELGVSSIHKHLNWSYELGEKVAKKLINDKIIEVNQTLNSYQLTRKGTEKYKELKEQYGV